MIRKGTLVRLRTTNGGDGVFVLANHYRPTYACWIESAGRHSGYIEPSRIVSVDPIIWADPIC
jgi:hypothetical protein